MDFGLVSMVGGQDSLKAHGSGKIKQERSGELNVISQQQSLRSGDMLSFSSSSKSEEIPFLSVNGEDSSSSISIPFFQSHPKQGLHSGNASVYAPGGLNEGTRGNFSWLRGPFTPSQWMELEHQALIYKHLVTNVPIPSNLLVSLKKSLSSYTFSGLSSRSYASNWGAFHLGFGGNTDPEPGRCRRTDGKKWRCSRDAVLDQKYCERHINRGRHRSRKPVEGQTAGRATSSGITATSSSKVGPVDSSAMSASPVISSGGASNSSFSAVNHQFKNTQQSAAGNPSTDHLTSNRTQGLSLISPSINLKSNDSGISNPLEESSHSEFGFLSSDSLLNLSQKSHVNSKSSGTLDFNGHATNEQHPPHHFADSWSKEQQSGWPELKSDWTQLSMSNFSSSSISPRQEKHTLSPQKSLNWLPVSWGNSMGGPLGEVLNGSFGTDKNSSNLNLMTEAWDSNPHSGLPGLRKSDLCLTLKQQFGNGKQSRDDDKKAGPEDNNGMGDDTIGSNLVSSVYSINVCL